MLPTKQPRFEATSEAGRLRLLRASEIPEQGERLLTQQQIRQVNLSAAEMPEQISEHLQQNRIQYAMHIANETQDQTARCLQLDSPAWVESRIEDCKEDIFVPGYSHRKNQTEHGSFTPLAMMVREKMSNEQDTPPSVSAYYSTNTGQICPINPKGDINIERRDQNYQSSIMSTSDTPQPSPSFVQCHSMSREGIESYGNANNVLVTDATGDMTAYQICSHTTSLPQGVVMASSPGPLHSFHQLCEEASCKRERRLLKNREAARECRRKKKQYVRSLVNQVAVLENQNKTLNEELKALQDLYCHKIE